jgi:D-glycero-D-manno-heptose 1,7-bisphosphate phosphatase
MSVGPEGLWIAVSAACEGGPPRPALFLDRDGVIVEEVGYLADPRHVRLIDGAAAVIAHANALGVPVIVVTNQSGIGRGFFGWAEFAAVEAELARQLRDAGAHCDAVLACPYHAAARPPYNVADHPARKPNPGLLFIAAARLAVDLAQSWIVGDRAADLAAGRNAGLAGGLHVATGFGLSPGERPAALRLASPTFRVFPALSLAAAGQHLPLFGEQGAHRRRGV